uniref:Uncharacterized protein n=1 Tax=Hyaloperonospora arabidopsidis (strain Emoy2) TaxID=559515 RepID=M4B1E2_HYAAE
MAGLACSAFKISTCCLMRKDLNFFTTPRFKAAVQRAIVSTKSDAAILLPRRRRPSLSDNRHLASVCSARCC